MKHIRRYWADVRIILGDSGFAREELMVGVKSTMLTIYLTGTEQSVSGRDKRRDGRGAKIV